jgi:pimeloyl-ACP methyl ester carboxylesterase
MTEPSPTLSRRNFIGSGICFAFACLPHTGKLLAAEETIIPVVSGPEVEAFKIAQQNLLRKHGVSAESRYLKLKKSALTVHVLAAGRGEPVLLLHGGGGFACQFAPLMGPLQTRFRLFAADRPGCGLTDKLDYSTISLRSHAVGFVTSLLDGLDLPKAALAGASMGGLWALYFALARPERVAKLVLLGEPAWSPRVMTHAPPPWRNTATRESIRAAIGARQVADVTRVSDEYVDAAVAARRLPGADLSWNTLIEKFTKDGMGTYHLRPELKNLKVPTLFIWGDKDKLGPPTLGEEMAKLAPNARCEIIRDAGHLPWLDHPQHCARLAAEVFRTN